jgi:hypothetical protein
MTDLQQPERGELTRLATNSTPVLATIAVLAIWAALSLRRPELTYHFGPLLAAAAWPVTHRSRHGRVTRSAALRLAAAAFIIVAAASTAVWLWDGLNGPALVGGSALAEAFIAAAVGAAYGGRVLARESAGLLASDPSPSTSTG